MTLVDGDLVRLFDDGGRDLDGLSIVATLNECIARAFCERAGVEFDTDELFDQDSSSAIYLEDAGVAVDALIAAGFIRREDFEYDESTHSVRKTSA
jgi:hypothetical protein